MGKMANVQQRTSALATNAEGLAAVERVFAEMADVVGNGQPAGFTLPSPALQTLAERRPTQWPFEYQLAEVNPISGLLSWPMEVLESAVSTLDDDDGDAIASPIARHR
jgi:hypothetical protein